METISLSETNFCMASADKNKKAMVLEYETKIIIILDMNSSNTSLI